MVVMLTESTMPLSKTTYIVVQARYCPIHFQLFNSLWGSQGEFLENSSSFNVDMGYWPS